MGNEIWLPISGYEGFYEISHFGRVRSYKKYAGINVRYMNFTDDGHRLLVTLHNNNGKRKQYKVHHLVLSNFNCQKPEGMNTCHNDGDYTNNYIGNLRWDTSSSNMQDAIKHGKRQFNRGENSGQAKLKSTDVSLIRNLLSTGETKSFIANQFNVARSTIINISQRKTWAHE